MKRLGLSLVCLLTVFALSGCAGQRQAFTSYSMNLLSVFQSEKAPEEKPATTEICLLDPVAAAVESSGSAAAPAVSAPAKPPVAEVPVTTHDFGKMSEELDFVHRFSVKNVGNSVLNIKKVVPG
ncbi:MAG: hypothetical protein AB9866_01605 [Syntrophobacteraceae bacterium]